MTTARTTNQKFDEPKTSKLKPILSIIVVICSIAVAYGIIRFVLKAPIKFHKQFFKLSSIEDLSLKLNVLFTTLYYVALYLIVIELLIMTYRIWTGKNPVNSKEDPRWVICLNRIVGNTIEQCFIFFPIYAYWLHVFNINNSRLDEALSYPILFLIGRVLFAAGYLFGNFTNIFQFRSTGFAIGFALAGLLTLETQGVIVVKKLFV